MKYDPQEFINSLTKKMGGRSFPQCPICGGENYTSTDNFVTLPVSKELGNVTLGPNIPTGMVICENCGHIEFFALGALGLINKEEHKDGKN